MAITLHWRKKTYQMLHERTLYICIFTSRFAIDFAHLRRTISGGGLHTTGSLLRACRYNRILGCLLAIITFPPRTPHSVRSRHLRFLDILEGPSRLAIYETM